MHSVFFQPDAQNHATSRTLVLAAGETLEATDCLCVQDRPQIVYASIFRDVVPQLKHDGKESTEVN